MTTYSTATTGPDETAMRHNDGAMVIMQGERHAADRQAVLHVPMFLTPKRGQGWCTSDPVQEAFAARVVAALNAAQVEGVPAED
jgi:hypothetical protein